MPHPAALQQVPEHMLMEMACRPARRREAVLAASHIRSRDVTSTMLVSAASLASTGSHAVQIYLHAIKNKREQPVLSSQCRRSQRLGWCRRSALSGA